MARRSRFTVHTADGRKICVLAYSAESARQTAITHGFTPVTEVERGDYRAPAPVFGGFTVTQSALADAIDLLDLKLPVKIRYNGRYGATAGNYRFAGGHHDIMLKSYLTPEQASSTLWHELTHAMQAERVGATIGAWADYRRGQKGTTYYNKPMEREARAMSATMKDCPLTTDANYGRLR